MTSCAICSREVYPSDEVCRELTGWEKKSRASSRRGGSDVLLREHTGRVAHLYCVNRSRDGLSVGQGSMSL